MQQGRTVQFIISEENRSEEMLESTRTDRLYIYIYIANKHEDLNHRIDDEESYRSTIERVLKQMEKEMNHLSDAAS